MKKAPVSVIIAAFNEEKNIAGCLESVQWADQIIVVDGHSTDRTRAIASEFTSDVKLEENSPAETQRLKGLAHARHDWFFLLDADERVSAELKNSIERALTDPAAKSAYYVKRANLYKGRPVHLHSPDYQLRLFKKNEIASLPTQIHRIPQIRGEAGKLTGDLLHYFFTTVHAYLEKLNTYTRIEASYRGTRPGRGKLLMDLTLKPAGRFVQYYFVKKGFLDGFFGLFYSVSSAYYEWAVISRLLLDPSDKKKTI